MEVMVAFAVLAIALSLMVVILQRNSAMYFNAVNLEKAVILAHSKIEEVRLKSHEILPSSHSQEFKDYPGFFYHLARTEMQGENESTFYHIKLSVEYPLASGGTGNVNLDLLIHQFFVNFSLRI